MTYREQGATRAAYIFDLLNRCRTSEEVRQVRDCELAATEAFVRDLDATDAEIAEWLEGYNDTVTFRRMLIVVPA